MSDDIPFWNSQMSAIRRCPRFFRLRLLAIGGVFCGEVTDFRRLVLRIPHLEFRP